MPPKAKRVLLVTNPGSDSESDSPDERHGDVRLERRRVGYEPPPISPYSPYSYSPKSPQPSLPSSSSGPIVTKTAKSNPRITNAPTPTSGSSNRSSPAPDTTPPPSTPGQSHPPTHLSIGSVNGGDVDDRDERDHALPGHSKRPGPQPGQIFDRSYSAAYAITRPPDPQRSVSSPPVYRSLEGRVVIMATTDGDTMTKVDISGATESAFIRETIFTKLRIADEDQTGCQIFRTTLGEFPIGDALNDEDLFRVCATFGDASGSLKFLVQNRQPRGTEVFLPPVPVNSPAYALNGTLPRQEESPDPRATQQRTRQHSQARDDGQSSTSGERISAGYDASVSGDDMPSLPNPHAPHRRLRSNDSNPRSPPPLRAMSPQMSMASLASLPAPNQRQGSVTPTPPPPPPLPLYSDQNTRASEADARERILRDGENTRDRVGKEWEAQRQRDRAREQWQQDPSPPGPPGAVLDIQRSPQLLPISGALFPPQQSIYPALPSTARPRQDPWVHPAGARQPSGGPRPLPQASQSPPGSRGGTPYSPYPPRAPTGQPRGSGYPGRLPLGAAPPHNPSRRGGQPVPSNWFNQPGRQPDPVGPSPGPNPSGGGLPPPRLATTKSMDNLPKAGQNRHAPSPTYRPPLQPASGSDPNSNRNRPQHPQLQLNPSYRAPDPLSAPPPSPYNQLQLNPNFNSQYSGYPPPSPLSPGFNPSPRHGEFTPESLIPGGPGTRSNLPLPYPSDPNDFYPNGVSPVPVARPADEQGNRVQSPYGRRMASPPPDMRHHRQYPVDVPRSPRPWSDVDPGTGSSFTNQPTPPMRPRQSSAPSTTPPVVRSLPPQPGLLPMEATPPASASTSTPPQLPPIRQESGGWSDDGYGGVDRSPWNHNQIQQQQQQQHHHRRPSLQDDAAAADDESEGTLRPSQREELKNYMNSAAAAGSNHSNVGPPGASVHFGTPPNRTPQSEESTLIPPARTAAFPPPPPLPVHASYNADPGDEDEDEDDYTDSDEENDEDYWNGPLKGPPAGLANSGPSGPGGPLRRSSKRRSTRGPPLTLKIANDNPITVQPPSAVSESRSLNVPAHAEPPPASKGLGSTSSGTPVQRRSSFIKRNDQTWAFRPPAEDVIDRLGEFFPDHDLDKPVIETAASGSSSPTLATGPTAPPVPGSSNAASGAGAGANTGGANVGMRKSHKKSIRHVAYERKRHMDRDSKLASTTATAVLRRHSTKFWGSRVEELTPAQERSGLPSSVPESPPAVNHNTRPIIKWVKGELIGKGTYGKVFLAMNITAGEMMAVKQVDRPQTISDMQDQRQVSVVEALKSESETLKNLDHPHIVQYLGFEETPEYFSIFLEYVPGGSVAGCLRKHGKFEENIVKSFTSQILDGLEYLHKSGILHRDMKADNILVDHMGICKISDFGISKRGEDIYNANDVMTQMQGSVFWMAPEVMHKEGYNAKIDIWSLGCIVMEMWAGRRPWNQEDILAVMYKLGHLKEQPPVPDDVVLTPLAEDFRMQCLAINPVERPTAAQLRSHPYLTLDPGWTFTGFR